MTQGMWSIASFQVSALLMSSVVSFVVAGCTDDTTPQVSESVGEARSGAPHPLDPLTAEEISAAREAVRAKGYSSDTTFLPIVRLEEPSKADVLRWQPGDPIKRKAFVVVFEDTPPSGITRELIVALDGVARVVSDTVIPNVQPPVLNLEYGIAGSVPLQDRRFQRALIARGYGPDRWATLICLPLSAGNYHIAAEANRRLFRVTCLDGSVSNPWARPIENLHAVVDLVTRQVIDVVDTGVVPQSTADGDYYSVPQAPPAKPLYVVAPGGDDYTVDGHVVTSPRWQLHFKVEDRDGLVISGVKYNDKGSQRSVFYRANLSETFVPYADPTSNFYYRTYMDEGEYGFGKSTQPLTPNKDCPENATFYPATITDDVGNPVEVPNAVCIFEEKSYLELHHFDIFTGIETARTGRNLTVRYATIVGNYDYFFDWTFRDNGSIGFKVGAGGILETKGQKQHTVTDAGADRDSKWGSLVDDWLGAPNHQHIFNLRLDMDVDGTKNTLVQLTPTVVRADEPGSHRTSGWTVVPTEQRREGALSPADHTQVTVFNEHKHNAVGNPVGYAIESNNETTLLMRDDDPPAARASYTKSPFWVTPYDARQRYAAGDYVFMDDGSTDGIQHWVEANRKVNDTDLVVWANVGFSHITHSENWPLMSTEWFGSLELEPFNFFDRNPALDLNDAQ